METTKLSSKGQIILPKAVRDHHRWEPGTEFVIEDTPEGVLLRPSKPFAPTQLKNVAGCLHYSGPAKTLADMEAAIATGVRARRASGRY